MLYKELFFEIIKDLQNRYRWELSNNKRTKSTATDGRINACYPRRRAKESAGNRSVESSARKCALNSDRLSTLPLLHSSVSTILAQKATIRSRIPKDEKPWTSNTICLSPLNAGKEAKMKTPYSNFFLFCNFRTIKRLGSSKRLIRFAAIEKTK